MKIDLALTLTPQNYYDIDFDSRGDFLMTEGFDTACIMTFFCERRASNSEVPTPELQGGWWGNLFNGIPNWEQGSKNWLLYQARLTQDSLNRGIAYNQEAFNWLVQDNFADRVQVNGIKTNRGLSFEIILYRSQNPVGSFSYPLWQGTGLTNGN